MNPNTDLFSWLCKYKPGASKTPMEDFFTQAFAWLLSRNPSLCAQVVQDVFGLAVASDARIETQRTIAGSRIDMQVSDQRTLLFVESKLESSVATYGEDATGASNQIALYQELLQKELRGRSGRVVLVTQYASTAHGFEENARQWRHVYDSLKEHQSSCTPTWMPLLDELLHFMENLGMAFTGLTLSDADVASRIVRVYSGVTQLIEQSAGEAGFQIKRWEDYDAYRSCYLKEPAGAWLGVPYWGDQFGNFTVAFQSTSSSHRPPGFDPVAHWGPQWNQRVLPFSEYAEKPPSDQVRLVASFLKKSATEFSKACKGI
jgi:hypothetical protein